MPDPISGAPEPKPVAELVKPVPSGIKTIALGLVNTLVVAGGAVLTQFLVDHSVEIGLAISNATAGLPSYVAYLVGAGFTALVVWAKKRAASTQRGKVLDALVTEPTQDDLKKLY